MQSILAILESAEQLLSQAEAKLVELEKSKHEDHLGAVLKSIERCKLIDKTLQNHKERILLRLVEISLAIGEDRYTDVGERSQEFHIKDTKEIVPCPCSSHRSVSSFIFGSRHKEAFEHERCDFDGLCIAILGYSLEHLDKVPQQLVREIKSFEKLLAEMQSLLKASPIKA